MPGRSGSRTRFSSRPLYFGLSANGSRFAHHNTRKVFGNEGWPRSMSQTPNERRNARTAYRRFKESGYEGPNNGNVCLQTTLGAICFATVAAAIMWLEANQASIMKGGRKTRKQYKKRSTRN